MLSWMELVLRPEHELAATDLILMNLVCARGLPGTQGLDIAACVRRCDEYAERVRNSTFRQAFAKRPEHWDYSWAKFRAHAMIAVFQRQCGFRYNYATTAENCPFRPEDTFVQGILFGEGGTCASLPVLYAAIGRRLGYPLKIVKAIGKRGTNSHFFCRWDDPGGERFNIETTAADGLCCLP